MKKIFLVLAAGVIITGCATDGKDTPSKEVTITVGANHGVPVKSAPDNGGFEYVGWFDEATDPSTRTVLNPVPNATGGRDIYWSAGDEIGVCLTSEYGGSINGNAKFSSVGANGTSSYAAFTYTGSALDAGFYVAYYPYTTAADTADPSCTIPAEQKQTGIVPSTEFGTYDFSYSDRISITNWSSASFTLNHAITVLEVSVTPTGIEKTAPVTINSVTLKSGDNAAIFYTTLSLTLPGIVPTTSYANPVSSVTLVADEGTGYALSGQDQPYKCWIVFAAPANAGGQTIVLSVNTSQGEFTSEPRNMPADGFKSGLYKFTLPLLP